MSHELELNAYNGSDYKIKKYSITHEWNGKTTELSGDDLNINESSKNVTITSGYGPQKDNWTINILFDRPEHADQTKQFYCNSSHADTKVTIRIKNNEVNCEYNVSDPCNNKSLHDH